MGRFLTRTAVGVIIGLVIGLVLLAIFQKATSATILVIAGAVMGVVVQELVIYGRGVLASLRDLKPLRRVLGSIATEDSWIYVSAWRRDLRDLDHSRLYRNDPTLTNAPQIVGSALVYGYGDAIALSLIQRTIEKASWRSTSVFVEDTEQTFNIWGRSAVCIGAHNSKTREILAKFDNPYFGFEANYRIIVANGVPLIRNADGVGFRAGVTITPSRDSSWIDYGVILKLRDQYHPDKNVIVVAGIGDVGTAGAAYFLLSHYKDLPFDQDTFGVLVEVPSGYGSARRVAFTDVAKSFVLDARETLP